jgi:hypothetical protein
MEVSNKRSAEFNKIDLNRIAELEHFLFTTYPRRLRSIERAIYLGYEPEERRYDLELEAYEKEQEYRELMGLKRLPELKNRKLI